MNDLATTEPWTGMVAVEDTALAVNPRLLSILTGSLPKADAALRLDLLDDRRMKGPPSWVRLSALIEANLRAAGINIPGR